MTTRSPSTPADASDDGKIELDMSALDQVVGGMADPTPVWEIHTDVEARIGTWQDDLILGDNDRQLIIAGGGDDAIFGGGGDDVMLGGGGHDKVFGGDGNDILAGGTGVDVVDGGAGDDLVVWSPGDGNDMLHGGDGTDELRLERTGLTIEQVLAGMTLDPWSAAPVAVDGGINLAGVSGRITIGGETFSFSGFERLTLSNEDSLWVPEGFP
ncbi:calcium-binding protein [Roseomonas sp. F4]